jgi:filamentous hemagglutinin family protein
MKTMNKFISLSIIASLALVCNNLYGIDDNALPQNPIIKSGAIQTSYDKNNLNIIQSSQKAIIDWNSFNIGQNASVNFQQPNNNASILNRVTSSSPSEIFGKLSANGEVFLINPNGVIFGKNSKVDVGSFIVSTMDIKDEDYLKSKYAFDSNNIFGKIINEGELSAKDKGFIVLLAPEIINEGVIEARFGNISLASGEKINLFFDDKEFVSIEVLDSQIKSLIENKKMIITQDGKIFLSAKSKNELLSGIIKNTGVIEANSISSKNGEIFLDSSDSIFMSGELNSKDGTIKLDSKNIEVSGKIDSGNGDVYIGNSEVEKTTIKSTASVKSNFVETSAKTLQIEDGVKIEAKEWLLDPTNITIDTLGTEILSGTPATTSTTGDITVSGSTINASLNNGTSVLLDATNNITINDNILKNSGTESTLTFKAGNNISVSSGKSISSSIDKLNLVLWSDSDGSNAGGITLNSNSSIITNGGHLWIGGGLGTTTWNGLTVGNSYARGTGVATTAGIEINGANIYTNGGNIKMYGYGPTSGGLGIHSVNSTISTQSDSSSTFANGQVNLRGDGYWTSSGNGMGIYIDKSSIIGGSGGVNLEGHAETTNGQYNYGIYFKTLNANDSSNIYTLSNGQLDFNLYANITSGSRNNHFISNDNGIVNLGGINQTGNINIYTYGTSDAGLYLPNVKTTGNLLIDVSNSSNIGSGISPSWASTTWGYWDMGANVLDIDGITNIIGNTSKTLSAKFDNIENDFGGAFSSSNLKNIKLLDKNSLILGSLNNFNGTIDIATLEGNIDLTQNISTSNTSTSAITLNAGKSTVSGISTGGNVIHTNGTITTGLNGRSTLYTGNINDSTGLSSLIGSGNFRYNSDETTTNYNTSTATLGSGIYAVYREQPILSVTPSTATTIYGNVVSVSGLTSAINGYLNGDNSSTTSGTAIFTTTATNTSDVGTYDIAYSSGFLNSFGYGFINENSSIGEYSITPRAIELSATNLTKIYGEIDPTLVYTITNGTKVGSDDLGVNLVRTSGENVNTTTGYAITNNGTLNSNYDVTFVDGKLNITPRIITLTADSKSKIYGDNNPDLTYTATGFVNNENLNNIYGKAFLKTNASINSNAGSYVIDITKGSLESQNYDFIFKSGILKVERNLALENNMIVVESLQAPIKEALKEKITIRDLANKEDSLIMEELKTSINKEISKAIDNLKIEDVFEITQQTKIIDTKLESKAINNMVNNPILEKQISLNSITDIVKPLSDNPIKNDFINEQIIEKSSISKTSINLNNELTKDIKTYENDLQQQGFSLANSQAITNNILKSSFSNFKTDENIEQTLIKAYGIDKNSVSARLSNGSDFKGDAVFDKVFQNLIQKGIDPKEALKQATSTSVSSLKEVSFSKQIDSLSDEQVKMTINLIAKGYSKNEAIQMSKETVFPKESFKTDIVTGKVDENLKYLDKYLNKYSLEESVKLASKFQEEKRKYEQIDEKNVILSFVELSKKGVIPNSLLFEKILSNELKRSDFKTAYKNALEQYSLLNKTNQDFPLEKLVKGELKKDLTSNEKIWWIEFTKNIMNGDNQDLAKEKATKIEKLFLEKEKFIENIENRLNKGVVK